MPHIKSCMHAGCARPQPTLATSAALAAGLALAFPAGAQTSAPAPTALPEIQISAPPIAAEEYKADTMSSPKFTQPLLDTPQTITVIPTQVLEEQNRLSLVEALSTVPGITFGAGEGGGGYGDSINFRGYSANSDILLDGLRDSAQYNRSDTFNIDRIEVISGASSVYSGAGSVGGSINLVSKTPRNENFFKASGGLGTDDYRRLTVDFNRKLSETSAIRLNAMAHRNDVPGRDVEKYERWGIAPSISFGMNTPTTFTLGYLHQRDDNVPQYGVPYYQSPRSSGLIPGATASGYYGYRDVDKQEIGVDLLTGTLEHKFSDTLSLRNITRLGRTTQLSVVDPPQGTWCLASGINVGTGDPCAAPGIYAPSGPRGTTRDTTNDVFITQTDLTSKFETGTLEHTLVGGLSISHERFSLLNGNSLRNPDGSTVPLPTMSIANPAGYYGGPVNFIPSGRTKGELNNVAAYVFDNLKFNEKWQAIAGLRYEHNSGSHHAATIATPAAGGATTWGQRFENSENLLSYRVGLVYKPVPNASFYIAHGNSKTPSKASVNGACAADTCNVAPESAVNYEIGTKWDVFDKRLSLTAAIFRNQRKNYKVPSGDPTVPEQQLDGKSQVDGLALGIAGQITPRWGVFANYAYLKSKVKQSVSDHVRDTTGIDAQAGNPLTGTPEHSLGLWTTYAFAPGWTAGYGLVYQGSWYVTNGAPPLYKASGYAVHNAMLAYRVNRNLDLQLNIKNITDKLYYTRVRNNGWAVPGDGRAVTLTASYTF